MNLQKIKKVMCVLVAITSLSSCGKNIELPISQSELQILRIRELNPLATLPGVKQIKIGTTLVDVPQFEIQKFEVSYAEYNLCSEAKACPVLEDRGRHKNAELQAFPVVMVSAYKAQAYCYWLGYRLPTEVEFERASKGFTGTSLWPWGDEQASEKLLNVTFTDDFMKTPMVRREVKIAQSYSVGAVKQAGIHNLAGNVSEWTASSFKQTLLGSDSDVVDNDYGVNPDVWQYDDDSNIPQYLVVRGGSYKLTLESITDDRL